ncbi:MAG: helix-turn-helix domain-containing protein, partial [Nanoarchaeota archaeon]
ICFITIVLCFHIVSALEIESYKITATPIDGNYVENVVELTVFNNKEAEVSQGSLTLAKDAEIIAIADSYGSLQYTVEEETENKKVTFTFEIPIKASEERVVTLQTKTYNIIQKEGYFEYLLVLVPSKDIVLFTHILRLEKDVDLYRTSAGKNNVIIPDANITETETNIIIEWKEELQEDTPTVFLVRFSQETGINYWKWFGVIIIIGGIGALIGIGGTKVHAKHRQNKALKATNLLNEREKAVLERIIRNPEIKQYELIKELGYTKSNMSKIIKRLELRGLVEVKKDGKVRILTVGEKIKKEL